MAGRETDGGTDLCSSDVKTVLEPAECDVKCLLVSGDLIELEEAIETWVP